MSARPSPDTGFAVRLAAFYAALFVVNGIQLPFFPLWLEAKGLDAQMIGLALAVPMVVRVFAIPYAARQADRRDALRAAIIVASLITVAGYVLVGVAGSAIAIIAAFALASAAITPLTPLAETYALVGLRARGRAYGPVRLWGSAAFIAGNFAAGFAADIIPARDLIWLMVATTLPIVIAAFTLPPLRPASAPPHDFAIPKKLLHDRAFLAVVASAALIQASHAVYYGFSTLAWSTAGLDGTTIAALWALGVVAEIVLFAVSGRLPKFLSPTTLLLIGAGGAVLRWGAMAFDPPALALPWLQLLHALSFGATHLGALGYLARHAPAGRAATAQGIVAVAAGAVMALSMGLSGVLFAAYGSAAYAAMALAGIAGGACALVAQRISRHALA